MHIRPGQCVIGANITSVIFGMEGVVIDTAQTAAAAWKSVLDPFLRTYATLCEAGFVPFDLRADYLRYFDGRPRTAGVRDFLTARDIRLPYDDLRGLTARQEEFFFAEVRRHGVTPYTSAVALIRECRRCGLRTAVVSTQRNGAEMLRKAGLVTMFDLVLDGPGAGLLVQPDSALLLQAALRLGARPRRTAVVERTVAALNAAHRGGFGLIVGIDRRGGTALCGCGADHVVTDLADLRVRGRRHVA
jgi:beta-phosphoglucomutase-like phosphatase (HAD superfamily)